MRSFNTQVDQGGGMYSIKNFIFPVIWLLFSITMVAVGSIYSDCSLGVLLYLKIAGGIMTGISMLSVILITTSGNCCRNEVCRYLMSVFMGASCLGVMIWGSVVVFGPYNTWTYDPTNSTQFNTTSQLKFNTTDSNSETYCNFTPYMLAFVFLIIQWVISTLLLPKAFIYLFQIPFL